MSRRRGKVYLVGAGPGDPGLLTLRAVECLRRADVVLYDRLVDEGILQFVRQGAERIGVGKGRGEAFKQEEINHLMASKALEGKRVVRLKGGDPFVFGRGGEEAEFLASQGIPFEVVPGVTSAVAVPAYAGIPLTHRRYASSFTVLTGHRAQGGEGDETVVVLMGLGNLQEVVGDLLRRGRGEDTPVAVISWGTSPAQRCVTGTLGEIVSKVRAARLSPPAVVVVGEVARLRERLRWFDDGPLFGRRVMVAGTREQTSQAALFFRGAGAWVVEAPLISREFLCEGMEARLKRADWVVFSSPNAVEAFFHCLFEAGGDVRRLSTLRFCTIGPVTARALRGKGVVADLVPARPNLQGLLRSSGAFRGRRVLWPRSEGTPSGLAEGLRSAGFEVEELVVCRYTVAEEALEAARAWMPEVEAVVLLSLRAAAPLAQIFDGRRPLICIGPKTAEVASQAGLKADLIAPRPTMEGLLEALGEVLKGPEGPWFLWPVGDQES